LFDQDPRADHAERRRIWKTARQTSRAAFFALEETGWTKTRQAIVGRGLRYLWNRRQRGATAVQVARWLRKAHEPWSRKEWTWTLITTRRALDELRQAGLADSEDGPTALIWKWVEQGCGQRPYAKMRVARRPVAPSVEKDAS
jgi:hypothetical protein